MNPAEPPFPGGQYPSPERSAPQGDPFAPVDYPTGYPPLPPPVHPQGGAYPPGPVAYGGSPGYPGYPAYPGPYDPYRWVRPSGTNPKAVAALVTALAGLAFCGLPSIAGLILGIIAMRECRRTGQEGFGLALAGTIIGGLVVALIVLYIVVVVAVTASGWQWAP